MSPAFIHSLLIHHSFIHSFNNHLGRASLCASSFARPWGHKDTQKLKIPFLKELGIRKKQNCPRRAYTLVRDADMFTNNYNITENLCAMKDTSKANDNAEDAVTNFKLGRMRKASQRRWLLSRTLKDELVSLGQGIGERYSRLREQSMGNLRGMEELSVFMSLGGEKMMREEVGKEVGTLGIPS